MISASCIQISGAFAELGGEACHLAGAVSRSIRLRRGVVNCGSYGCSARFRGGSTYNFTNPGQKAANKQGAWLDRAWPPG